MADALRLCRSSAVAVVLAAALAACGPSPARLGPGLRYPPLPAGWNEVSAYLLPAVPGLPDHIVTWVQKDSGNFLWLGHALPPTPREPRWELRDTLRVPAFSSEQALVIGACSLNRNASDAEIVALANSADADSLTSIVAAWRADRRSDRWQPLPVAGIACHNVGYGLD